MADQNEGIVRAYAEHLARKAGSVVVTFAVGGTIVGAALAFTASKMPGGLINPGVRNFAILLGAIAGGFLGRSIGEKKAAVFKLQSALVLHQAQLAQKLADRPVAPAPVPAPAPAPLVQAAPVAPAPVAPAPLAAAPAAPAPAPPIVSAMPVGPPPAPVAPLPVASAPEPLSVAPAPITLAPAMAVSVPPVVSAAPVPQPEPEPEPELPAAITPIVPVVPVVPRLVEPAPAMPPLTPPLQSSGA
jgi:hypothetical protein